MKLIGKLKDNVANAETKEAVKQLIEDAGMLLDDQELDQVCGGKLKDLAYRSFCSFEYAKAQEE